MEIVAGYVIKALLLPPGVNLFAAVFALLFLRRSARLRRFTMLGAFASLWFWCTPFVAAWHAHSLEYYPALDRFSITDAEAIVVLGGGRYRQAPEYDGADSLRSDTLERVRYGAILARQLNLPVAVTGGAVLNRADDPLGVLMAHTTIADFNVAVHWVEDESRNTAQNASFLRQLLPVKRIILVTHSIHMPRSVKVFENAGFAVTPAPMGFTAGKIITYQLFDWLPSATALITS